MFSPHASMYTGPFVIQHKNINNRSDVACEQALCGALVVRQEKEGELATTSLEFEFHLQFSCGSLSTELSDFCQSAPRGNEQECKQTLKNLCQG